MESYEFCLSWSEAKVGERRRGVSIQPHLRAEGVANGRKSFPEKSISSPPRGVLSLGVVCPETDDPHGVKRAGSRKIVVPVLNRCCFMAGFCANLEKNPVRAASSRTRPQVAQSTLCTPRPRCLCSRRSGEAIIRSVVSWSKKASLFSHHILLRAGIYTVNDKKRAGPLRKIGGGLPE